METSPSLTLCGFMASGKSALGKRLARQLIYRADFPHAPLETTYVAGKTLYQEPLK